MTTTTTISHLANVHPQAKLGEGVTIEPFATVQGDVEIGDGSWIGPNAVIQDGARLGREVKVFPGAVVSTVPQDLKYRGEYTTVIIGNRSIIREFATINRGTSAADTTVLGDDVLIMAYAHVAHDCILGNRVIIANTVNIAGHVTVEDNAIVGGSCAIHQFVRIGQHSMIGGGSLVRKDVPPFIIAAREPLSYAGVNYRGLQRRGYTQEQIRAVQEVYRKIFLSGLNITQAIEAVEHDLPASTERDTILDFVRKCERGLCKPYSFLHRS
jgi:UDP-N-acetylglucosamine acyltransferase